MKLNKILMPVFLMLFTFFSCFNNKSDNSNSNVSVLYDFTKPSMVWKLPNELKEISGIAHLELPNVFAINDEEGIIYEYNLDENKMENKIKFHNKGDYEDIAIQKNIFYIVRSDGTIFIVENGLETSKHKTFLTSKDDVEGMEFDAENNRLLLVCKNKVSNKLGIYAFNLKAKELLEQPILEIPKNKMKQKKFAPSGLAIHPITKTIFVISSIGKTIIELSLEGDLLHEYSINYRLFRQPEGIFFDKKGDLYISNEANGGVATILKFEFKK